ncbi:MAG: hypothetical protein IJ400_06230 [Clostridia bacterium]|nr:hypothetical protein [Clostridia bacterium]
MKELKKLLKKKQYENIIKLLLSLNDEDDIDKVICFLKKEETFVDRSGKLKHDETISRVKTDNQKILSYFEELNIINLLFAEERKMQSFIDIIPKKKRLANVLYYNNYNYIESKRKIKSNKKLDPEIELDGVAILYNSTIKTLVYDNEIWDDGFLYKGFCCFYDKKAIKNSVEYTFLSRNTHDWETLFNAWKHGFVTISKENQNVYLKYINSPKLVWFRNSKSKLQIYNNIYEMSIAMFASVYPNHPSNEFNNVYDNIALNMVRSYLHIDDSNTRVNNIPIKYWVIAYRSLIRYSQKVNFINSMYSYNILRFLLSNLFLTKRDNSWKKLFIKSGIPKEYVDEIFDALVFTKKSTDLYDFPFVKVKEKYMIMPALLHFAEAGQVLKSRVRQQDFNISEKGKGFEKEIKEIIKSNNIPTISIHRKESGSDYECDLAFVLDETLFLCECKDNGDKYIFNEISDFYMEDVDQLNRIADYYTDNIGIVKEEFKKAGYKIREFKKVYRILIYNTVFHSCLDEKGVKIVDYEKFIAIFRRGDLDKRICSLYNGPISCLSGKITETKLLKYLNDDFIVCNHDKIVETTHVDMSFGDYCLKAEVEQCNIINNKEIQKIIMPY